MHSGEIKGSIFYGKVFGKFCKSVILICNLVFTMTDDVDVSIMCKINFKEASESLWRYLQFLRWYRGKGQGVVSPPTGGREWWNPNNKCHGHYLMLEFTLIEIPLTTKTIITCTCSGCHSVRLSMYVCKSVY